jgi:hypothetical protein
MLFGLEGILADWDENQISCGVGDASSWPGQTNQISGGKYVGTLFEWKFRSRSATYTFTIRRYEWRLTSSDEGYGMSDANRDWQQMDYNHERYGWCGVLSRRYWYIKHLG